MLYENGPFNGNVASWQINFGSIVSDTLTLPGSATVRGFDIWVWESPGDQVTSVDWSITLQENGGTIFGEGTASGAQVTDRFLTINSFGYNIDELSVSGLNVPLQAGTFWFNVQNAVVPSGKPVYWDENSGTNCGSPGCPSQASESAVGTIPSETFDITGAQTVPTSTTLSVAPPSPAVAGQVLTFTATVTSNEGPVPVGTVTFSNGGQVLGTVQMVQVGNFPGTATLRLRFGPGTYSFTANYNGTNSFQPSQSSAQPYTVTGTEPTITTLTAQPDGSNYDFTDSVFGFGFPPPTGSATVNDLTEGGFNLGNIGLAAPGQSSFLGLPNSPAGSVAFLLTTGDFNGDGIPDLAVSNGDTLGLTVNVLLGNGDGTFQPPTPYTVPGGPLGITTWDFNGDGNLDLAVARFLRPNQGVSVFLGNGDGTFQAQVPYNVGIAPTAVAVGDFNADGAPDLAVADFGGTVFVLLNNGDGTFTPQPAFAAGEEPMAIAVGDFNRDGNLDVAVADHFSQVAVLLGNGDGTFQAAKFFATGAFPFAIAVGDLNGDGILDLAVTNVMDATVSVLLGNGNGTFNTLPPINVSHGPAGIVIADLNGDGFPDLAVSTGISNGQTVTVLLGNGDGTFQPPQAYPFPPGAQPVGLVTADFNGDGVPDLAAANNAQGAASVLLGGTVTTGQLLNVPVPGRGRQNIQSTYTPNTNFYTGSLSNIVPVTGLGVQTATVITSSQNPSSYLQPVTFTATVTDDGGSPTGTVTFTADGNVICAAVPLTPVRGGSVATCLIATLTVGPHSIVGSYSGDSNFAPSQSPAFDQVVNMAVTTTIVTASPPSPSSFGQLVTFTATLTGAFGGSPTGPVTFTADGNVICSAVPLVPMSNGSMATCQTASLAAGAHTISAGYQGDSNYNGSSGSIPYVVNEATTVTTLSVTPPSPVMAGQVVTFTATVTISGSPVPAGTVTFSNGRQVLGTVQLVQTTGIATLKLRFAPGTYSFTANYTGTNSFESSQSAPQPYTVTGTEPTISTLSATPDGSNYDFALSVFGFGFLPLSGSATLNNLTQGGTLLGNIGLAGPGTPSFQPQQVYGTGVTPYGVATVDFNGDGILDLAICNFSDNTVGVLLGNSDGTFQSQQTYQVGLNPFYIAIGDFNGDGIADLAVANLSDNTVGVLLGNGNGTFQPQQTYPVGSGPSTVATADFNGDGIADLAVTDKDGDTVSVLLGNGNGTFQPQQTYATGATPVGVAIADFNGDGIPDLAIGNFADGTVSILLGNGNGTFQPQQTYATGNNPIGVAIADFNGDGIPDLAIANSTDGTVSILLGKGDGTFQPQQTYASGTPSFGVATADFNGDGIPDLAVGTADGVSVLLGKGDGTFQPAQSYPAGIDYSVATGDFNGDGVPDIAAANLGDNTVSILLGGTLSTGQLDNIPVPGSGTQNIQSTFTPNGILYANSLSNIVQVVNPVQVPTTTALSSSVNPSSYLQPVTFTATVTDNGGSPTGTVTFTADTNIICAAVPLAPIQNGSTATCSIATLTVGSHNVVASYSGDNNFGPSNGTATQTVLQAVGDFFLLPISPRTVIQGYNNSNEPFFAQTINVTVMPSSGYNGTVTLSCSVTPTLVNGTCLVNPPSSGSLAIGNLTTTLTISATNTTPIGPYTVTVTAQDSNGLMHSTTFALEVVDYAPPINEPPGGAGMTMVSYNGPPGVMIPNFACTAVTGTGIIGSEDLSKIGGSCVFGPGPMNLPGTVKVTISGCTVARLRTGTQIFAALWLGLPGLVLLGSARFRKLPRKRMLQVLGTLLLLATLLLGIGCGAGSGQLTPAGSYLVLVQGTGSDGVVYSGVVPVNVSGGSTH